MACMSRGLFQLWKHISRRTLRVFAVGMRRFTEIIETLLIDKVVGVDSVQTTTGANVTSSPFARVIWTPPVNIVWIFRVEIVLQEFRLV